jgi:hypothetical protein
MMLTPIPDYSQLNPRNPRVLVPTFPQSANQPLDPSNKLLAAVISRLHIRRPVLVARFLIPIEINPRYHLDIMLLDILPPPIAYLSYPLDPVALVVLQIVPFQIAPRNSSILMPKSARISITPKPLQRIAKSTRIVPRPNNNLISTK